MNELCDLMAKLSINDDDIDQLTNAMDTIEIGKSVLL